LGFFAPMGGSLPAALPVYQPNFVSSVVSSPNEYFVVVPARAACSHSASVGKRIRSSLEISSAERSCLVALSQKS
jgi:hypothetical protein